MIILELIIRNQMEIKKCNTSIIICRLNFTLHRHSAFSPLNQKQINDTHFKIITFHHSKIGKNQIGLEKYHFHFIYISIHLYLSMTNIIHFRNFYHITIFLSASNGNI